jgi:glutamate synthase domain-containing protein 3
MVGRLKSDRVVYDLRKFNFDKELHHLYRQQEIIEKEYDKQKGEDDRTEKFKTKFVSHLSAENIERSNHMNIVQGMVGEKVELL